MPSKQALSIISEPDTVNKIYQTPNQKIMPDNDWAELYGVYTKRLHEQVRNFSDSCPEDFMFGW